jgi:hypothetical protein
MVQRERVRGRRTTETGRPANELDEIEYAMATVILERVFVGIPTTVATADRTNHKNRVENRRRRG